MFVHYFYLLIFTSTPKNKEEEWITNFPNQLLIPNFKRIIVSYMKFLYQDLDYHQVIE
jgi:hypothetical protein